jgi:hypothetical protein
VLEKFGRFDDELGLREESKRDPSAAQGDSFADEREEKATDYLGPASGRQAE